MAMAIWEFGDYSDEELIKVYEALVTLEKYEIYENDDCRMEVEVELERRGL